MNRPVARVCISLSSGISMFARESETRVVRTESLLSLSRGVENTKSLVNWIRLPRIVVSLCVDVERTSNFVLLPSANVESIQCGSRYRTELAVSTSQNW